MENTLYRRFWRWHFYAGLFVIPFVIVLALSGSVYLFKAQIERWEERGFRQPGVADAIPPSRQVEAALAAFPGTAFHSYRLPAQAGGAALVHVASADGGMRDVFVAPDGRVLGSLDSSRRIAEFARRIHGGLLMGTRGGWLVELAACWAIVMIVTGLFLWWPRGRRAAGVLWPRRRSLLRDLHAVTGFWIAGFVFVLLLTGLPWTDVWGNAFGKLRAQMGWVQGAPQWNTDGSPAPTAHGSHDHGAMHGEHAPAYELARLDAVVAHGAGEPLAYPTLALAPGAVLFGPPSPDWTLTSQVQNRPQGLTLTYDATTAAPLTREAFADRHVVDRVIGYGLAWHEGALFGAINQLIGVLTAAALVTMSVTGFLIWRRRRPAGQLGAPAMPAGRGKPPSVTLVMLLLAALLPLLAASLLLLWLVDLALPRLAPRAAAWLGMPPVSRDSN